LISKVYTSIKYIQTAINDSRKNGFPNGEMTIIRLSSLLPRLSCRNKTTTPFCIPLVKSELKQNHNCMKHLYWSQFKKVMLHRQYQKQVNIGSLRSFFQDDVILKKAHRGALYSILLVWAMFFALPTSNAQPTDLNLNVGISTAVTTVPTGTNITYFISYGTQSLNLAADDPQIVLPIPPGTSFLGFAGTTDVVAANEVGSDYVIDLIDPLPAGQGGIMAIQLFIPAGSFCDGDIITASPTFTASNANNSPQTASVDVTVEAGDPNWEIDVSTGVVGVPGANSVFDVTVSPASSTGFISLATGTVSVTKPAGTTVVNCDGCMVSGNTLTWNVSNLTESTMFTVALNFPAPPFDFGDTFTLDGSLNGTTNPSCPFPVSDTDTEPGMLPNPNPLVNCAINMSEYEVGASGTYTANALVTGNTEIDDLTLTINIPPQINLTSINNSNYLYDGINATLSYTTNMNPTPQLLGNFVTSSSGAGGFALPTLGANEYLTGLIYEYGTVPPGFEILGSGISLSYDVLAIDQNGNTVVGANPRVTLSPFADCPGNATYTCISPSLSLAGSYQGMALSTSCDQSRLARTPPNGPGSPAKSGASETGTSVFPGQEVNFTISFQQCGQMPLVNGI
jgi:hypothetical protein